MSIFLMKTALTIGNFDGVHRGHQALVEAVTDWRRAQKDPDTFRSLVLTFEPHPVELLRPGVFVPRLTSQEEKNDLLRALGIDEVNVLNFTQELAQSSAENFFKEIFVKKFNAAFIAIGENFFFGRDRQGNPEKLKAWCDEAKISARIVKAIEAEGAPISSTRIRKLIEVGETRDAARLLGRNYSMSGLVQHGDKRGRQLGFPTANLIPSSEGLGQRCLPKKGVYLSTSLFEGQRFPSITNVGIKPTVQTKAKLGIETHLLDFNGDLYGKVLTVEFRDRLRDEMKFGSIDELRHQIQADTALARARLKAF